MAVKQHRNGYPYPDNPGLTHYSSCWRYPKHHNCAVAFAEQLAKDLKEARDELDQLRGKPEEASDELGA